MEHGQMRCPKCVEPLLTMIKVRSVLDDSRVLLDRCDTCKGVWFDADELKHAMAESDHPFIVPRNAKRTSMPCPRCDQPLFAFVYDGTEIEIDMCNDCRGIWVDHGELKVIQQQRTDTETAGAAPKGLLGFFTQRIEELLNPNEA